MGTVATLTVRVNATIGDFDKQMAALEKSFAKTGTQLKSIGTDLSAAVTLPIAGVALASIKAAKDFESSFAGIRKTVDGVVDGGGNLTAFGRNLQQQFRDLAKTIPVSVNELNRIGESAGQLGIHSDRIIDFTKTIAAMAVTTNLSAEQAADGMARFANVTQMPQENIDRLASTIVRVGNSLATTESELLDFSLRIAGAGHIVGLTEAEIVGIAGAFASVGIEADAGGTAVQKALLAMNSAVTSGKGLQAFGGQAFKAQFKADPGSAFAGFIEQVGAAGKGGEALLRGAGFDDARQIRAFLSLASAGDLLRNSLKMAGDEWERNTALTDKAQQRYGTFESQLQLLKNQVNDVAITIGTRLIESLERMAPSIEKVLDKIADVVDWFSRLPTAVQDGTFELLAVFAAAGPLAFGMGMILKTTSSLIGLFKQLGNIALPAWMVRLMGGGSVAVSGTTLGAAGALGGVMQLQQWLNGGGFGVMGGLLASADIIAGGGKKPTGSDIDLSGWSGRADVGATTNLNSRLAALTAAAAKGGASHLPPPPSAADEQYGKELQRLKEQLSGADAMKDAKQWMTAVASVGGVSHLTNDELKKMVGIIDTLTEQYRAMSRSVPKDMIQAASDARQLLANAGIDLLPTSNKFDAAQKASMLAGYLNGLDPMSGIAQDARSGAIGPAAGLGMDGSNAGHLSRTIDTLKNGKPSDATSMVGRIGDRVQDTWKGMTGGNGVSGLFSNIGGGIITGGMNALMNLAVSGIMKGLSKLGGMIAGLFTGGEGHKANTTRDAAIEQFTGLDNLGAAQEQFRKLATEAGLTDAQIRAVFDTHKVKDFESAFQTATDKIQQFNEEQAADQARLTDAIQKYGFAFEELGHSLQTKQLNDQAKDIAEDWRVLVAAGIEVSTVNTHMADTVNAYIASALQAGVEVPFALKPILQSMVDQGVLFDANGNKITDLQTAGITFAETMTQGFDRVVAKLQELINHLNGAGAALQNVTSAAAGMDVPGNTVPGHDGPVQGQDYFPGGYTPTQEQQDWIDAQQASGDTTVGTPFPMPMARGGMGRVTRPTLFLAGEAGPEDVAFSGANKAFDASQSGGGGGVTYIDNRTIQVGGVIDKTNFMDVFREHFMPAFRNELALDANGCRTAIVQAVAT